MNSSNDSALMHWVSPFGHRRLVRFISAYRRFSQISTSFIASDCLGIHRVRFIRLTSQPEGVSYQIIEKRHGCAVRNFLLCGARHAHVLMYAALTARLRRKFHPARSCYSSAYLNNTSNWSFESSPHYFFNNVCFNFQLVPDC